MTSPRHWTTFKLKPQPHLIKAKSLIISYPPIAAFIAVSILSFYAYSNTIFSKSSSLLDAGFIESSETSPYLMSIWSDGTVDIKDIGQLNSDRQTIERWTNANISWASFNKKNSLVLTSDSTAVTITQLIDKNRIYKGLLTLQQPEYRFAIPLIKTSSDYIVEFLSNGNIASWKVSNTGELTIEAIPERSLNCAPPEDKESSYHLLDKTNQRVICYHSSQSIVVSRLKNPTLGDETTPGVWILPAYTEEGIFNTEYNSLTKLDISGKSGFVIGFFENHEHSYLIQWAGDQKSKGIRLRRYKKSDSPLFYTDPNRDHILVTRKKNNRNHISAININKTGIERTVSIPSKINNPKAVLHSYASLHRVALYSGPTIEIWFVDWKNKKTQLVANAHLQEEREIENVIFNKSGFEAVVTTSNSLERIDIPTSGQIEYFFSNLAEAHDELYFAYNIYEQAQSHGIPTEDFKKFQDILQYRTPADLQEIWELRRFSPSFDQYLSQAAADDSERNLSSTEIPEDFTTAKSFSTEFFSSPEPQTTQSDDALPTRLSSPESPLTTLTSFPPNDLTTAEETSLAESTIETLRHMTSSNTIESKPSHNNTASSPISPPTTLSTLATSNISLPKTSTQKPSEQPTEKQRELLTYLVNSPSTTASPHFNISGSIDAPADASATLIPNKAVFLLLSVLYMIH